MTPGELAIPWQDGEVRATLTEEGWDCPDARLLRVLRSAYAPEPTTVGDPVVQAFHRAAEELRAKVVQAYEADPPPEGAIF